MQTCAQTVKVQGSLEGKGMPDHSYSKEKLQAEPLLGYSKLFWGGGGSKSSSATEIQCLMEQMVEVLDSGTFIVMLLNAKHQEWISPAVNLIWFWWEQSLHFLWTWTTLKGRMCEWYKLAKKKEHIKYYSHKVVNTSEYLFVSL